MEKQKPQSDKKETIVSRLWRLTHTSNPPYYCYYSLWKIFWKPIRKWFSAVLIPTIPFSNLRVFCYRLCGYKIGKGVFIGMRCYLDDMQYEMLEIEDNVTISYGVYFACHGNGPHPIKIKKGAYIGMRSSIISQKEEGVVIGENVTVGASSLVNKSIPANSIAVGVPARVIKTKESNQN